MARDARSALTRAAIFCGLAFGLCCHAADTTPAKTLSASEAWAASYRAPSLDGMALVITVVEEDTRRERSSLYVCQVSADGKKSWSYSDDFGHKGGHGMEIPQPDFQRLKSLTEALPADNGRLPPAERRLLVQAPGITRVYDRAALSDDVAELLRLSGCGVGAWLPAFEPKSEIDARSYEHDGFLALSPDGKRILFASGNGPVQLWEPTTHETLGDVPAWGSGLGSITFSPDGAMAAVPTSPYCQIVDTRTWKAIQRLEEPRTENSSSPLHDPHFTPDGRHLVLRCNTSDLRVFDTRTWERVETLAEIPPDAIQFLPAKSWRLAIVLSKTGVVSLWNPKQKIATELDKDITLTAAAFSPDESLVAVATADNDGYSKPRLRIFSTDTGKLLHQLRPYEGAVCEKFRFPLWTPDGRYLLAVTKSHAFFTSEGISIWNSQTGRHRGELTGCPTNISGVALLSNNETLVAGCSDGHIRFWDFSVALKQIATFEQSLGE